MKFHNRQELINWLELNAPHKFAAMALQRAPVTVWGLFEGGLVVEAGKYILGIRASRTQLGKWICGELRAVPWKDYIGGNTPLTGGDYPIMAIKNKSKFPQPLPTTGA